ncbi:MAG TPA: hypothetical protein DC047_05135 [Blastocatellia bacterium]|nr:hypothetical protein [Blastocatellia bacterium]
MAFPHWQYFIAIESDLEKAARYVEIAPQNFHTYSVEFAHILLSASSEVDVVSKLLCRELDITGSYSNINHYRTCIVSHYPRFPSFKVSIPRYGLERMPWRAWDRGENPSWWASYNDVKHERNNHFGDANLENTLDAVAGLLCLMIAYHRPNLWKVSPWPKLLHVEETERLNPFL